MQVGFQSLGSAALPALRALIADGAIGEVTGIGAAGAWCRPESYWQRAPWAGKRWLNGAPALDGAPPILVAVSVCAPKPAEIDPWVRVQGTEGEAVFHYTTGRLAVSGTGTGTRTRISTDTGTGCGS